MLFCMKKLTFPLLLILAAFCTQAQKVTQMSVKFLEPDVVISYDLEGQKGTAYHITLFGSHDDFKKPLRARGDVDTKRVLPGKGKVIRWNPEELVQYDGEISFRIVYEVAPPLFTLIKSSMPSVKRGKTAEITWSTDLKEPVRVELVKGETRLPAGTSTNGRLTYTVPKNAKPGAYNIELIALQETARGASLSIKPTIPTFVKVAVLTGAIGGALVVSGVLGGGGGDNGATPESLPPPPGIDN